MSLFNRPLFILPRYLIRNVRCVSDTSTFRASDIQIQLCKEKEKRAKPDPDKLSFGQEYTDHMLEVEWSMAAGWGKPRISPFHNLSLHPAAKVLHYSVELFEGLKAYRGVDGKVRLFRPDCNAERMITSARRMALPEFDAIEWINCIRKLVSIDKEWVPYSTTSTLYIRPTFIGTEPSIGVTRTANALFYVIIGPVGPYFPTGFKPVSLLADPKFVRAWEGGAGAYKLGSNYGPTIQIQYEAQQKYNCQQILWLYGPDHMVTEVGAMNVFVFWQNEKGETELLTPPLGTGLILPGVTRRSLLELAKQWGEFKVTERVFTMGEVAKALKEKRVKEVFMAGTAAVVCPVGKIIYQGENLQIPTMDSGAPIMTRLYKELTDIQFARVPNKWMIEVD